MKAILRASVAAGVVVAGLIPAVALAGGSGKSGSASCGCTPPPPPCNCEVPSGHNVSVPGINITPPSVTVNSPSIFIGGANVEVQASGVSVAQSSSSAQASGSASAQGTSAATGYTNALAAANALGYAFGGGGGGGFAGGGGAANSYIPALEVVSQTAETRKVCAEFRAVQKVMAIQAVCLDDKAIPHPASQVQPERDVAAGYEGELFRCIAGARMQYTLADYAGSADFARGQTISCAKGEALYHSASGEVACRPQRPARDCNERSLLRRYGAGIKVLTLAAARQCVAYRSETAEGTSSTAGSAMQLDGGVGGTY
jgi:hypothetical protein